MNLAGWSNRALLQLHYATLAQLAANGVVRSSNSPIGDYAELLVQRAYDGVMQPRGNAGWDVDTPAFGRVQVKARVRTASELGSGWWGPVKPDLFDVGIYVLFEPVTVEVRSAVLLPAATITAAGKPHKGGFRFALKHDLLALPDALDVTAALSAVQET